ncbi:glycerophosphodiester phosphodiesterase [Georgenia sp. TF02-10]|uniref:glycerophosphodiester phosphodiesterase family protein n=1 Tax=Georgenia sp. TF02-10 TaxID=2917725 RepID=UPI001FA798FE|nr:glycerophosphodiester phosphodiesterase family protein [Georgenia sp. TF02-10]UNX53194.1 glycerophosphodiester phosphodiesterase [Georgenia sp. TF02-10]
MSASTRAVPWQPGRLEVIGHRGARGHLVENTVPSVFRAAQLGATAVEIDVQLTADGQVVVWHDPVLLPAKVRDTRPAAPGDPAFPYVGRRVADLSYDQLATLDVGSRAQPGFPGQATRPGTRIARLAEVLTAARDAAPGLWFLVELKCDPGAGTTAAPDALVPAVLAEIDRAGAADRVVLESFDWRVLPLVAAQAPRLPRAALAAVGETWAPGSPFLGPVQYAAHDGDLVAAAVSLGVDAVAPGYAGPAGAAGPGVGAAGPDGGAAGPGAGEVAPDGGAPTPEGGTVSAGSASLVCDRAFVERAHAAGLAVLPWTVNDPADLALVVAAGVDGVISDYPDRVRRAAAGPA